MKFRLKPPYFDYLPSSGWITVPCILAGLLISFDAGGSLASKFEIRVDKPEFVLPQFTGPYREREASLAPEEYETAGRLRSMLESNEKEKVLKELEEFYDIELSPAMLALKAQIYMSLEMYDKAEKTFQAVLARKPQLIRVHRDLGQLYLIQEKNDKAREHFAKAVSYGSNDAMVHGQLAYLNLTMYGAHSAINEYQQAMALEPDNRQWQQGLLAALSQAKMYESAQALLRELLEKRPNEPELWLNQAALALQMEDMEQALASLEMAILLGEDDTRNLETAAQLHLQQNSYERAVALLNRAMKRSALGMASVNEYMNWLSRLGMWEQAGRLLDNMSSRVDRMGGDDRSQYELHRARIASHKQNFSQAGKYFTRALENNPVNGEALLAYAKYSASRKDYVKAELMYMRAEAVAGFEKQAILGKAQMYIDMQDYSTALKHMKLALQKFPDETGLRGNVEIVENIVRAREGVVDDVATQ